MKEIPIKEALKLKYPEWVMLVMSRDGEGAPDIMPAGWCMICNQTPPMMAIAVGFGRYTHTCLEETGEFVLAWPGVGQEKLIEQAGSVSGRDVNKFEQFGLEEGEASQIGAPLVEGCAVSLECVVVSQLELEDHSIFVGEIVAAHVADPPVDKLDNFDGTYAVATPKA
ncbi:MAG: flavin reductase family protein [Armatimonadota bacterium]